MSLTSLLSAAAEHLSQGQIVCHVGAYGSQTAQAFARFQTQKLSESGLPRSGLVTELTSTQAIRTGYVTASSSPPADPSGEWIGVLSHYRRRSSISPYPPFPIWILSLCLARKFIRKRRARFRYGPSFLQPKRQQVKTVRARRIMARHHKVYFGARWSFASKAVLQPRSSGCH